MKERISIRQMMFLFIFISITPILSYIPKVAAINGKNNGYVCAIYYTVLLCIFAGLLLNIVRVYPGKNFYEILTELTGKIIAKVILFLYGVWGFLFMIYKISSYSLLLKTTMMPDTASYITIGALFLLILYAVLKGTKTIFRIAEFLYGPVLFILVILFFFAFTNINREYLVPISTEQLKANFLSLKSLGAVGGNLFLLLIFLKPITLTNSYPVIKKRMIQAVLVFFLLSFLSILLAIGISGASLTGKYTYSIFQTLKCVSLFQTFERFDSFITILCVFSDFVTICIFMVLTMKCFSAAFGIRNYREIGVAALTIGCVFVVIRDISLYEMETGYRDCMDTISLIFEYLIPVILGIVCLFKRGSSKIENSSKQK